MSIAMIPLAKGMLTAFIMTLGIGPGMVLNFRTSLRRGFVAGISVVEGLYASDLFFIGVNYFGVFHLVRSFQHQLIGGIACGAILCVLGISLAMKKPSLSNVPAADDPLQNSGSHLKGFLSGFFVNMTNPFVFIFWMTLMSIAALNFGFRTYPFFVYFAGVVGTALSLDIGKSYLFSRIKTGVKPKMLARINHGIGTVLAAAGIIIICRSIVIFSYPIRP